MSTAGLFMPNIDIQLLDARKKVLFAGSISQPAEEHASVPEILADIKTQTAQIIPQIVAQSAATQAHALERLSMVRSLFLRFEWQGELIEKSIPLRP